MKRKMTKLSSRFVGDDQSKCPLSIPGFEEHENTILTSTKQQQVINIIMKNIF